MRLCCLLVINTPMFLLIVVGTYSKYGYSTDIQIMKYFMGNFASRLHKTRSVEIATVCTSRARLPLDFSVRIA